MTLSNKILIGTAAADFLTTIASSATAATAVASRAVPSAAPRRSLPRPHFPAPTEPGGAKIPARHSDIVAQTHQP